MPTISLACARGDCNMCLKPVQADARCGHYCHRDPGSPIDHPAEQVTL